MLAVAELALPLEGGGGLDALLDEASHHVACVHVDGAQRDQLLALVLGQVGVDDSDQVRQLRYLLLVLHLQMRLTPGIPLAGQ